MRNQAPLVFADPPRPVDPLRQALSRAWLADETASVESLIVEATLPAAARQRIQERATDLVGEVRRQSEQAGGLDAFMSEYDLGSHEGVVLMCLAEALLRVPDTVTADRLIEDKLGDADWDRHLGHSGSLFVNASTWALLLTGRLVHPADDRHLGGVLRRLASKGGKPVIRQAVTQAMRIIGRQFVLGRTIDEALARAVANRDRGYRHSFDMLGEGARTGADAARYLAAYENAITVVGAHAAHDSPVRNPSVSVKLSALHPRYLYAQHGRVMRELVPRLAELATAARDGNIGLSIDAEEADRLDLSLDVLEAVYRDPRLAGWDGLGFVVQAYQKRAPLVIDWLGAMAGAGGRRIPVRLVKGAYWDSEIKRAQIAGLDAYPVFTRKASTDLSYLVCARRLLANRSAFHCQFASHNAHTLAAVIEMAGTDRDFEVQRLHGMGESLHDQIVTPADQGGLGIPSRVYAPVGGHEDLLAYLVRRLLENGANTSFVNRIVDRDLPIAEIVRDPVPVVAALTDKPHPDIPLPAAIYGAERRNAAGCELADPAELLRLSEGMTQAARRTWQASPLPPIIDPSGMAPRTVTDPADRRRLVGTVVEARDADIEAALASADRAGPNWDRTPADTRAAALERTANLYEANRDALLYLCVREAGKTLSAALAELREAVDFLRYYASCARRDFTSAEPLPGPTGEVNELGLHGRGVFACISPWNFPLAIFTGQISAGLAAGNAVIAKPAEQTPLIAAAALRLFHEAGVPEDVLQLLPGDGAVVGARLVADPRIAGVAFTGSNETARAIAASLATRPGPIVPFIAETGGLNAMIVDSSALPEQVVDDVIYSAFDSAGQRCSALRVLFLQDETADRLIEMLTGAMAELRIGDPGLIETDIGPVIDADAKRRLDDHIARMTREAKLLAALPLPAVAEHGCFVAPHAFEIDGIERLEGEVFGPVLHVVRYRAARLDAVVDAINATGYGLTLGVHSRVDATVERIRARARVGNLYVNRNMIGAVVGVQPFGGEGLSGTGPKAGGAHYLPRFATERAVSVNTAAAGGNTTLLSLDDG